MLLAVDVGGKKTALAVYDPAKGLRSPVTEETLSTSDFSSLEALIEEMLRRSGQTVSYGSIGVPGPVIEGHVKLPDLPWPVSIDQVKKRLGLTALQVMNQLESIAYSVPALDKKDIHTLIRGKVNSVGNVAVIAPGLGLGEVFLTWNQVHYRAHASEGSHANFAPTDEIQMDLLRFLLERHDYVSYENVCSAEGLLNIYEFLKAKGPEKEPVWLSKEMADAENVIDVILKRGLEEGKDSGICSRVLEIMTSILATEAGNTALQFVATGGVYLGGWVSRRLLPVLKKPEFARLFREKGDMTELLKNIPVHVILNENCPMLGAAAYGLRLMGEKVSLR